MNGMLPTGRPANTDAAEPVTADDGYAGPAELLVDAQTIDEQTIDEQTIDEQTVAVSVKLAGHFDPISGKYSWYGRVAASPAVTELMARGARAVVLRTPHSSVDTVLSDVDPWGRPRVAGFGATPFAVSDTVGPDTVGLDTVTDEMP